MKLYRLKSNPTTIVRRLIGNRHNVVWTEHMEKYGISATWMIGTWLKGNVTPLTESEAKEVKKKIKEFKKNHCYADSLGKSKIGR